MLEALRPWFLPLIIALGTAVALSWSFLRRFERSHRLLMAGCACLGVWSFTLFGQFHDQGKFGHQNFHSHDFYHYYFGAKYLRDWGYEDMYLATVAGLEEVGRDEPAKAITFERIRDLGASARFMHRDEFLPRMEAVRARFKPARWRALKKDLSFLREKTMNNSWWQGVMLDSGFNPPQSYAVISGAVADRIPFNEATWKWLGGLDFVLLGIGVGALCYALGPVPGLFVLVIMGNAPVTTYNWTGGSFLRQIWVFFLMIGLAALARRRWATAGAALGASTASVLFPLFFLFGAFAPLQYRYLRTRSPESRENLLRFVIGAASALALLVGLSLLFYGVKPWSEWAERIFAHAITFFDNHIGIKKVTTFAPEVARQHFGASDVVYPEWNFALVARVHRSHAIELVLAAGLSIWITIATLRSRPAEACLIVGSGLLVFWTMAASYYTIYVGAFAGVMLANRASSTGRERFMAVCTALLGASVMCHFERDLVRQSFLLSVGWILCIVLLAAMSWIEHPPIAQTMKQLQVTAAAVIAAAAALFAINAGLLNRHRGIAFLPPEVIKGDRIADAIDVGETGDEASHHLVIPDDRRIDRSLMDTFGYLETDACRILKKGRTLDYDLATGARSGPPSARRLVIRTDSYYRGELRTSVNGRVLAEAHLVPQQSLFAYVEVPLPADLGDGPLHVEQSTTASDVAVFTVWLLEK
ncbi:MAG: hypothetical protein ACREJ3_11970 [Polyangiaceae bacterium]